MRTFSLLSALALCGAMLAQELPETTFSATVKVVVVPAVVRDRNGDFINGLRTQDFRLTDNDKVQDIRVDTAYVPISLVVAIQANSAVEAILPKIQKIGVMLQASVAGEQGEVAVISFDHRVELRQDFTSDVNKIQQAVKSIRPGGSSNRLNDAVMLATRMLQRRPEQRRRVILLISETRDRASEARAKQVLTAAQFANVAIYPVDISRVMTTLTAKPQPPRPDPVPVGGRALPAGVPITASTSSQATGNATNSGNVIPLVVEIMRQVKSIFVDNPAELYSKWTGGREYSFVSQRDLERAIAGIGEDLGSQYTISYSPNNREEGGFHDIRVSVPNHQDAKVRCRPGYWIAPRN